MCHDHYIWKNHWYFLENLRSDIRVSFLHSIQKKKYTVSQTHTGLKCSFVAYGSDLFCETLFLDTLVTKGVFRWVVQFRHYKDFYSSVCLGTAPPNCRSNLRNERLEIDQNIEGSCSFEFWRTTYSGLCNRSGMSVWGVEHIPPRYPMKVNDKSVIAVEISTADRTLSTFVNGRKIGHVITNVRVPLHFGITNYCCPYFQSLRFYRLATPTLSNVVCILHPCRCQSGVWNGRK